MGRFSLFLALLLFSPALGCSEKSPAKSTPETEETRARPNPPAEAEPETTGGDLGYGDDARLFDSAADAVSVALREFSNSEKPRVIAFGEYHKLTSSKNVQSALRRFADTIFDVIAEESGHLILETWQVDPKCGEQGQKVRKQVEATIERPPETESEMTTLLRKAKGSGTMPHALHFDCDEYAGLTNVQGLDTEALLTAIRTKLEESAQKALASGPEDKAVLIYGGATHNNRYPYKGLEHWSFAESLAKSTNNRYLEIDLYVPEFVKDDELLSTEAWYPLLKEARTDKVILIRRDPTSYILLMRTAVGNEPGPAP